MCQISKDNHEQFFVTGMVPLTEWWLKCQCFWEIVRMLYCVIFMLS